MQDILSNINSFLATPLLFLAGWLLKIAISTINSYKTNLDNKFSDMEKSIEKLEATVEQKMQFVLDKVINIAPEKHSLDTKMNKTSDRISLIEKVIGEISRKMSTNEKGYATDMDNFKKILFTLRNELNQLTREIKSE